MLIWKFLGNTALSLARDTLLIHLLYHERLWLGIESELFQRYKVLTKLKRDVLHFKWRPFYYGNCSDKYGDFHV